MQRYRETVKPQSMKIYLYTFVLTIVFYGCVEPFEPEVGVYDSTLVVDALLSNSDDPSRVTLTSSFPYSENAPYPVGGAKVVIEDDEGNAFQLLEIETGVFQTDPSVFKGQVGKRYRLLINTSDGNQFESDWELMKPAPPIEELRTEFEERIPDDPILKPVPGVQFYLSTKDTENNTRYYRWEFVETYQFLLPFPPLIGVNFGRNPGRGDDEAYYLSLSEWEGNRCWKTAYSTQVLIATTENLTQDIVKDMPLHFVDNKTARLSTRYSLLVKQYAISKTYYEFLRKIKEINQTSGSLFDPIPNEVFGNIRSSDGNDIPVLGYFSVAGVSEQRTFVNRIDLPNVSIISGPKCYNDTISYNFRTLYNKVYNGRLEAYDYLYNDFGGIIGFVISEKACTRCATTGATNEKPDFW